MRTNTDRRGVAAVEFALVAPLVIMLALGVYDLVAATTTWWHLTAAAQAVGQIATSLAANPNNTNSLTSAQAYDASTAAYPLVPQLAGAAAGNFGVVLTSVVLSPCASGCTVLYSAAVAWSVRAVGSGGSLRPCGALTPSAADGSAQSSTTLPPDAFTPAPMLVVDVTYDYVPVFAQFITQSILMTRTAYLPMRTGADSQWVAYTGSAAVRCPGF